MTIFEFAVTYAVCWWLVLFMVLPYRADAPKKPVVGHVPSAPANPMIKKKMLWATLLAFIPVAILYFVIAANAHAADGDAIMHASSGCKPLETHARADVEARDGYGTGDKKVKPATLGGPSFLGTMDTVNIGLDVPAHPYIDPQTASSSSGGNTTDRNVDLSQSYVGMGQLSVHRDGKAELNGRPIINDTLPDGCDPQSK